MGNLNIKKTSLLLVAIIPNAYVLKSMLYFLPDVTLIIYILLYGLTFTFLIKNYKKIQTNFTIFDLLSYLWILVMATSLFYSPYHDIGLEKLLKFCLLGLAIVFFIRLYVIDKKDWNYLINSYIFSAFVVQACVIITFIANGMPFGRFTFFNTHPIPLGMLGSITAIVLISQLISKKVSVFFFCIAFSTSVWIVLISSSKGPLIAMGIGLLILLPSLLTNLKRAALLIGFGGITFYFFSDTEQYKSMVFRLLYAAQDQSTHIRLGLYNLAIDKFFKNPLIGGGVGVFGDFYPHNVFFEVIAEGGILLGGILVILFIWLSIKYIAYLYWYKSNVYFFLPLVILIMSTSVLMVSYTYIDLKFLYLGLGTMLIFNKIKETEEV